MDKLGMDSALLDMQKMAQSASQGSIPLETPAEAGSFGKALEHAIKGVNQAQLEATDKTRRFEMGDPDLSLAEVMISSQKSSLSFETMMQVRNRLITAYQEIMGMPM